MSGTKTSTRRLARRPSGQAHEVTTGREIPAWWWWAGGAGLTLAATVAAATTLGPGVAVLVLAGAALIAAVASGWESVRALVGDLPLSGEDAFALGAPSAELEQKRAVLRAIKDLEFERSVGKISEEDFATLMKRYRREAKRLLRLLDDRAAPERQRAEQLAERYLEREGIEPADEALEDEGTPEPSSEGEEREPPEDEEADEDEDEPFEDDETGDEEPRPVGHCAECGTDNDEDAAFCKRCGGRLGDSEEAEA